jgi:hypothetical protein
MVAPPAPAGTARTIRLLDLGHRDTARHGRQGVERAALTGGPAWASWASWSSGLRPAAHGDLVRTDLPVTLLEPAATGGFLAANELPPSWDYAATPCGPCPTVTVSDS